MRADITASDGTGGESIYGPMFSDENFTLRHVETGTLSMANAGPNTNNSQFFLTLAPTSWLDGKHVVFGRVVAGLEVLSKMEACGSKSGKTSKRIAVEACGLLDSETAARVAAARASSQAQAATQLAAEAQAARETRLVGAEDPDAASARRLAETTARASNQAAPGPASLAARATAAMPPPPRPDAGAAPGEAPLPAALAAGDAYAGMDARARKLFELRLKLNESRKANQGAVVAEKRRRDTPAGDGAKRAEGAAAAQAEWSSLAQVCAGASRQNPRSTNCVSSGGSSSLVGPLWIPC